MPRSDNPNYFGELVPVVRCKDCVHFSGDMPEGWNWCKEHERGYIGDYDFCSYGERKDND